MSDDYVSDKYDVSNDDENFIFVRCTESGIGGKAGKVGKSGELGIISNFASFFF